MSESTLNYWSWKWIAIGLLIAGIFFSIMVEGLPELYNGKPVHEWFQNSNTFFMTGWGFFNSLTVITVLGFGLIPYFKESIGPTTILCDILTFISGIILGCALGIALGAILGIILGGIFGIILGITIGFTLGIILGVVFWSVLVDALERTYFCFTSR